MLKSTLPVMPGNARAPSRPAPQYTVYTVYWGAGREGALALPGITGRVLFSILNRFKKYLHKIIGWTE